MKSNNIALISAALALAIVASANAATPAPVPAVAAKTSITPFVRAGVSVVDSGLKDGSVFADTPGQFKSEVGGAFTAGLLLNKRHEFSLSTGFVQFEGTPVVTPGVVSINGKVEQVPVLFNYAYHLPIDRKGRWTVYGGPTIGVIHQTTSSTNTQLGGLPDNFVGANSKSENVLAYGASLGLTAKLSDHWSAGAAAQVLRVASSGGVDIYGTTDRVLEFASATRTAFTLSASYSW